jgi:sugar phosphate isomerase/epimerase
MQIATSTNILCERNDGARISQMESIRRCARAGYRLLDFCFVDSVFSRTPFIGDAWRPYILGIKAEAEKLGVSFVQAHAPINDFANGRKDNVLMRRSIEAAALLDIPWIVFHPSTASTYSDSMAMNIAYFRTVADYAYTFGIGIAIENMWGETSDGTKRFAIQAEELAALVAGIDRRNVGVCWDTEHGSIENLDQRTALLTLGNLIKATHISDETGRDNIHILPYMGRIDWNDLIQAFADIRYDGAFAFEIQHYLLRMPRELLDSSLEYSYRLGCHLTSRLSELLEADH